MFVAPSSQYEAVIDTGEAGLVGTIGVLVADNQGATVTAFSDASIVEIGSGVYSATRIAPAAIGQDTIIWKRGVAGEVLGIEDLVVTGDPEAAVVPPPSGGGAVLGPCSAWVDGDDVAACCSTSVGSDTSQLDTVALEASMVMFELSGRQFTGLCSRTVRPCRDACSCFGRSPSLGLGTWAWAGTLWRNDCGDKCGCGSDSYVRLAGYPVREITQVKVDGAVLDPSEYKLLRRRKLYRTSDPGPPIVARSWPTCQNLMLDDDQTGTFSISYTYGAEPPQLGRDAAAAFACELWKACPENTGECQLPSKVTTIVRQGITIERVTSVADMLRKGSTGLPIVDAFIAAYNPSGMRRRPAVWSPDLSSFARPEGV